MKKTLLMILSITIIVTGVLILLFGRGWNIVRAAEGSTVHKCSLFVLWFSVLGIFISDYFNRKS